MRIKAIIILCYLLSLNFKTFGQEVWTIGPMLHYNFGGEKRHFSWAIELAYWNIKNVPYSLDGGVEFSKKRIRLYSEVQTGIGVTGVSVGPVLEINKVERKVHLGYQTTFWLNYFIGLDYRYRRIDKTNFNCIGTYGKIPFATKGMESSSSSSYHDWDD
ncbi:MAG: hypothetical protein C0448_12750 [Sphingobacteriaceae bacterium]|nr:hypothetical protein [Sphingobacteriaceae bacterium]